MTKEQFIVEISKYIQKHAPKYNIKVYSPIIAQAILESGCGTSELAVNAYNYFGLKYRAGRCPTSCGIYYKTGTEQNADGSYTSSAMQWMKFPDMENGVIGYFDFINISTYANLKGITNPKDYLENIKKDDYATSLKYVDNLMNTIKNYDLTKYDIVQQGDEQMGYTNSPLVNYTKISPNKTSPRNHIIDTISIHCMAGNLSIETCGNVFAPASRKASSNYGIGSDGRIALYVEEKDRSWCTSNSANDNRAITIEVANDGGAPDWHVSDKAMASLIELLTDICRRNNIKELKWKADKSLIGQVDKQNMTVHRWFAAKSCPGDYLYNNHYYIAEQVNKKLGVCTSNSAAVTPPVSSSSTKQLYRVRKSWKDSASQIGAYSSLDNAKKVCKAGYYVFDDDGNIVYPIDNSNTSSTQASGGYTKQQFIKDVQSAIGAKIDGIAGNETLTKTITVSKTKNSRHKVVKPIQKYLNALGYSCGNADGIAGTKFDVVIKAYQKANGCTVDGEITARKKTWQKLLGMI